MPNIFFTSDHHFNHENILKFVDNNGERIRKEFNSVVEMNETMISRWNDRVQNDDVVYHLGDISFGGAQQFREIAERLNGRKRLIMGNHDRYDVKDYTKFFQIKPAGRHFGTDMTGCDISFIVSHIPLHPLSVRNAYSTGPVFNLHGHLHQHKVDDPMYFNVCVENTNYAPLSLEEVVAELKSRT